MKIAILARTESKTPRFRSFVFPKKVDFGQLFGSPILNIAGDVEQTSKEKGMAPSVVDGGPGDGVRRLPEGGEVNLPDDGVDGGCPPLLLNTLGYLM